MVYIFQEENEVNITFLFVYLISQNHVQRNKLRYLESRYLGHFHGIGNKH